MRRSYEFKKQESYVVHEEGGWGWRHAPSHEDYHHVSFDKPPSHPEPFDHHDDHHRDDGMVFNGSRWIHRDDHGSQGWGGTRKLLKKNECMYQPSRPNTILRPPLGSLNPPPLGHQKHHQYGITGGRGAVSQKYGSDHYNDNGGEPWSTRMINNRMEASRSYGGVTKFANYDYGSRDEPLTRMNNNRMEASGSFGYQDYDHSEVGGELESLINRMDSSLGGRVKKVEVIEYERTIYSGGLVAKQISAPNYSNYPPWVN